MCKMSPNSGPPTMIDVELAQRASPVCETLLDAEMAPPFARLRSTTVIDGPTKHVAVDAPFWKIATVNGPRTSVVTGLQLPPGAEPTGPGVVASCVWQVES